MRFRKSSWARAAAAVPVLLVAATPLAARTRLGILQKPAAASLFQPALELRRAGDVLGAIAVCQVSLNLDPDNPGARSDLGAAYVPLGRREDAIDDLTVVGAETGKPTSLPAATACLAQGTATRPAPPNPSPAPPTKAAGAGSGRSTTGVARPASGLLARANSAREEGDLERAIELYRQVAKASPRRLDAWWYLGTSLYELERWSDARAAFDRVVRGDTTNGAALAFRGLCTFKLGQYADALADLLGAEALGVGRNADVGSVARFHAGLAMTRLGQFELALTTIGEFALEGNDAPQIIEALGVAALRMRLLPSEVPGEKREMVMMAGRASYFMAMRLAPAARTAFEELALRFPDAPNVHYAFGVFLITDDPDRALEEFERELAIQPSHATSHIQIAYEYIKRGDYTSARPHAERARALSPTDFIAHRLMGQIQLEAGEIPAAIASLEQSRHLEPNSPTVYFTLAKAYARAGREADAGKARAEFTRLDRLSRLPRSGVGAVGKITP